MALNKFILKDVYSIVTRNAGLFKYSGFKRLYILTYTVKLNNFENLYGY